MAAPNVEQEFTDYVRARYGALLRSATLLTGDADSAQDLLQDALIKLAARWERVRTGAPDAYVRRILYRDSVSRWRKWRREVNVAEPADVPAAATAGADPTASWVDGAAVRQAMNRLTPKQRAVLVLRYYEDQSEAQIAETLGVSAGTVKSQAHVGLKRLRELLPDLDPVLARAEDGGAT